MIVNKTGLSCGLPDQFICFFSLLCSDQIIRKKKRCMGGGGTRCIHTKQCSCVILWCEMVTAYFRCS